MYFAVLDPVARQKANIPSVPRAASVRAALTQGESSSTAFDFHSEGTQIETRLGHQSSR
jgi:hypothetical protein